MNFFKKFWCRTYQFVLKSVSPLLNWRQPIIFDGENAIDNLCVTLKENPNLKILVVTDKGLVKAKIVEKVCNLFDKNDLQYVIFDQTVANPTL
ncbi:MAG: iron-containing alcohol dehydrogenase [Clostridia bacterium]|nr:iron-containing alcohol dehydrogenase [Clostridia bacterium]